MRPTRKVVFLLDPKHGYGVAEREEWNAAGQRTCHIQSEDWKNYDGAAIWLPSRCIAFYYARPKLFLDDFSKEPVHIVTNELTRIEFGPKNIPFTLVQTLELDMQNTFYDDPDVCNIIAEIPGIDPKLRDEVVMIGAHFDSWTFGTGATDNAAGSAMVMEAMRILKALNLQPRRTIRIALWTGEEQGALGSNAFIQQHLRDSLPPSQGNRSATKSERDSFSVYFNLDGGTGKIRGILNVRNAGVRTIFDAWMGPFKEMGMRTVSSWDIGGGDQTAFESVGLPSFGFIQDPIEYESRTHHTSADVYERIQPEDLQFNTAVLASFAWQAAQRDEKLPR